MTMLRFSAAQRVGDCLYRRTDGTLSYYFSCDAVSNLMADAGFIAVRRPPFFELMSVDSIVQPFT